MRRTARILVLATVLALCLVPLRRAARADTADGTAQVTDKLEQQGQIKAELREQLYSVAASAPATRLGEPYDLNQPSLGGPVERGLISMQPGMLGAYAYVQPYREPNDWAHRNYCGAGAAITLLSHFDQNYPQTANIDQIGREIGVDPNAGAWIYRIATPVNTRLNAMLGQDLNWYRFANARSLTDFRFMVEVDIKQNGVPFITGLMTQGLPGWGSRNVGHILTVYGYTREPDGAEKISYIDTAQPVSGYSGWILNVVELSQFWRAVSGNSAQVW